MSLEVVVYSIGLALLDSLNPATIATMMLLLPLVRKTWHASLFIVGTFIVYSLSGFAIYMGIDRIVRDVFSSSFERFAGPIGVLQFILGVVCITYGMIAARRLVRQIQSNEPLPDIVGSLVRIVTPYSILLLSFSSTLLDLPTALPLFGFIALLTGIELDIISSIVAFIIYGVLYVSPMLLVYRLYVFFHGNERYIKFEHTFRRLLNGSSVYLIPVCLILLGVWLVIDGFGRLEVDMSFPSVHNKVEVM